MAEPLAALLALALAVAPVPADSTAVNGEPGEPGEPPAAAPDVPDAPDAPGAPEATPPVVEGPEEAPTPAATPGGLCHGSRPCKRLVALASVSGGLGLAAIVAGGGLAARPQRVDPDDPTKAISYRPAGDRPRRARHRRAHGRRGRACQPTRQAGRDANRLAAARRPRRLVTASSHPVGPR